MAQQKVQAQKAAQQAADQAYFDAVRAQFKQSQAEAAAKGQVLTSQTITSNASGQGTVQSNYINAQAAKGTSLDPSLLPGRYQPDVVNLNRPLSVAPTGPQTTAQNTAYINKLTSGVHESGEPLPPGYEYVNPVYNQYFGSKLIGDIITEEVAKGDRGLMPQERLMIMGLLKIILLIMGASSML